ncbi:MAG: BREX-2 system phosphatase PglZ, partial [Actinobacteria bacterium]|nr:BREX-2 system phosphatase PglZ [Actinomycetota bacterium]
SVYADQQARAGRHALPADMVTKALRTLLAGGGRAHRETMARALGVSVARFNGYLSVLKRLLNVEGYEVLSLDADGHTLLLDVDLMKTQFGVS